MIDGEVEAIELRSAWVNGQSDLQTRLDNARRLHLKLQAQSAEHLERGELAAFDAVAEVAHAIGAVIREIDEASSFKSRSSLVSVGTSDTMSSLGGSRLDAFDPFQTQVPPSDPLTLSVFVSHAHWIPLGPTQTAYVTLNLKSAGGFGAAACSTEARLTPQGEASWFETLSVPAPVGCTLEQATQLVVQLVDASVTAKPLAYGVVELAADAALPSSLLLKTAVKHSTNVFELQPHEDPPVLYFNLGGDRWMHFPAVAYSTPPKAAELDVPAGLDLASHEAHSIATKAAEPMAVTRWDLASRVASSLTTPLPLGRPRPAALAPLAAVNQQQKEENAHLRAVIRRLTSEVSQWRGRFDQTSSLLCVAKEATGRLKAEATRASEAAEGLKKIESVVKDLKQSNAALSEDAMSLTSKLTDTEFALQEQRARYLNEVKVRKHLEKSLRQAEDKINAQRHKLHLCDAEIE
ncbi:MAG: uncharacterized protein KVP18_001783 [Porospora cf. gigantea A]|uniref:uncharacterized protein n=1 Tax=Porospora cf. gigantea A TaxID=2853593 RepID=UPI00355AAC3D|nr:MAG: hypothetical protein KVP18_001783 [Porospora cf. gigantea A]